MDSEVIKLELHGRTVVIDVYKVRGSNNCLISDGAGSIIIRCAVNELGVNSPIVCRDVCPGEDEIFLAPRDIPRYSLWRMTCEMPNE